MNTQPFSQTGQMIEPVWLNGWVFVYEISGCGFESHCSHLNFIFCTCFKQGVPGHSGNCRMWIHSETAMWHDKNIQLTDIAFTLIKVLITLRSLIFSKILPFTKIYFCKSLFLRNFANINFLE